MHEQIREFISKMVVAVSTTYINLLTLFYRRVKKKTTKIRTACKNERITYQITALIMTHESKRLFALSLCNTLESHEICECLWFYYIDLHSTRGKQCFFFFSFNTVNTVLVQLFFSFRTNVIEVKWMNECLCIGSKNKTNRIHRALDKD